MPVNAADTRRNESYFHIPRAKLLLVDDEIEDLHYYSAVLQHLGYEVRSCATYAEAANRLKKEAFDLLIVGQGGSSRDGCSVLAHVAEIDRPTPVFVLMAYPGGSSYSDVMGSDTREYVEKPLAPSELGELIATHLRQCSLRCQLV